MTILKIAKLISCMAFNFFFTFRVVKVYQTLQLYLALDIYLFFVSFFSSVKGSGFHCLLEGISPHML